MPATYLGGVSLGGEIPGVSSELLKLSGVLSNAAATLRQIANLIIAAKDAIKIPALAGFSAQLQGVLDASAALSLQLPDPIGYIEGVVAGIENALAQIQIPPPDLTIGAQLSFNAEIALSLQIQIDLVLAALNLLDPIIDAALALLALVTVELGALSNLLTLLSRAGAHSFLYSGPLSSLGTSLDSVTSQSGIGPSDTILATVLISSDPATQTAMTLVFKIQ